MKKIKFLILVMAAFFMSCDEESVNVFDGPTQVYFRQATSSTAYLFDGTAGVTTADPLEIVLAGSATQDVSITIAIDDASTAVAGTHYNLASETLTIPAGQFSTNVDVTGLLDGFGGDPADLRTLVITITDASVGIISGSETLTHTMGITCPSALEGDVNWEITASNWGGTGSTGSFAMEATGDGGYTWGTYTFGAYQAVYSCCEQERGSALSLTDVCTALSLSAADDFGCGWAMSVDAVSGPVMTVTLNGACGPVSHTVELTRADGADWAVTPD